MTMEKKDSLYVTDQDTPPKSAGVPAGTVRSQGIETGTAQQ